MADLQQFEPDTTQNDYDNDFQRLDANDDTDKALAGENPEEDLYSADPQPPSQPSIPEGDLLGGFGMGEAPQSEPLEPDMGGFDSGFGAPIPEAEPAPPAEPAVPDSTEPEVDFLGGFGIKSSSEPVQPEPEEPAAPEPEAASQPVVEPEPSEPEAEKAPAPQAQLDSSDTTPALGNFKIFTSDKIKHIVHDSLNYCKIINKIYILI